MVISFRTPWQFLVLKMYLIDNQYVGGLTANNVRNKVAEYFLTDAVAAAWQMSKIWKVGYVK